MSYRIEGLKPEAFEHLFGLGDAELRERNARRVIADDPTNFPCRITLEDAAAGETLLLVNHVSLDAPTPFRASHAIFVGEGAKASASYVNEVPVYLARRIVGLRGFDSEGMLRAGFLAMPGETEAKIHELFANPDVESIHAHTAAYGCFLAKIERN